MRRRPCCVAAAPRMLTQAASPSGAPGAGSAIVMPEWGPAAVVPQWAPGPALNRRLLERCAQASVRLQAGSGWAPSAPRMQGSISPKMPSSALLLPHHPWATEPASARTAPQGARAPESWSDEASLASAALPPPPPPPPRRSSAGASGSAASASLAAAAPRSTGCLSWRDQAHGRITAWLQNARLQVQPGLCSPKIASLASGRELVVQMLTGCGCNPYR